VRQAQRLKAICERHDVDLKAAALQFPLRHRAIASVLIGPRSVAQMRENIAMFEAAIPDELWSELDA
jgi:D-threo-aldose 1-dehydrogenase